MLRDVAEKYIKAQFPDWDHDSHHARAVNMFLAGVEWAEALCEEKMRLAIQVERLERERAKKPFGIEEG